MDEHIRYLKKSCRICGNRLKDKKRAPPPKETFKAELWLRLRFNQMVTQPTRITDSTEALLDIILVSNAKQVIEAKVLPSSISDHDLVYVTLRLKKQRTPSTFRTIRSFKNYSSERFNNDITRAPWSVLETFDDPDDKLHAFNLLFNEILDRHAPLKTIRLRGRPNPYITDEIRDLMATRDGWKRKFKQTKDPLAWSSYKSYCRQVKRKIRLAEKEFMEQQIKENRNNTNTMWKVIRSCIPIRSASQSSFSGDVNTVANEFNNFFVNIGKNKIQKISTLAEQFQCEAHDSSFIPREYSASEQFVFDANVNINQVQKIIKSMATNKSAGIDKIPIRVIKDCLPAILPSITSIINATFLSAQFPNVWKIAEVTPILKDGDRDIPNNYRPISLLPVLSKICERVAHDQLTSFLIANQRLSPKQCGNKKWNSTETSILQTTDAILEATDKKQLTATVLLDMSKAFDSVNHGILLSKLQDIGLSPTAIKWFCSYLQSRYQVVKIHNATSAQLPITCRVPQGSILGPLLFSIYTNDLPNIPHHSSPQCYVDDTKLTLNFNLQNQANAIAKLNEDLCRISNWTFRNQLLINPSKTVLIIFGSRAMVSKVEDFRLTLIGKEITPATVAKDLGVILDPSLTYHDHIASTVSGCMARLGQINRVKQAFDSTTLNIIINALVFSKLYYCCNVWNNTSEYNLSRIQAVQNFAARIVSNSRKYDHISPILKDLKWLPVRQQLYYRHAIMAFKCMSGCAPASLFSKYIQRATITKRTTRNSQMLNIPLYKTATGQRTFYFRTVKLWNSLDSSLKLKPTLQHFIRCLKRSLASNSFMT